MCSGTIGSIWNWWIGSYKSQSFPSDRRSKSSPRAGPGLATPEAVTRSAYRRRSRGARRRSNPRARCRKGDRHPSQLRRRPPPRPRNPPPGGGPSPRRTICRAGAHCIVRPAHPVLTESPVEVLEPSRKLRFLGRRQHSRPEFAVAFGVAHRFDPESAEKGRIPLIALASRAHNSFHPGQCQELGIIK